LPISPFNLSSWEESLDWARIRAAEEETSVSRLVGEMLREKMAAEQTYQTAMQEYLSRSPQKLKKRGAKYPRRETLY